MLLFGKVSGDLPDCEKDHPESNEDSMPHYLSDSQHHSDTICRRDREGPQGPQPHLLAEKPCRGNALLPGVEDRVAQFGLRRRTGEQRALAFDGRDAAHAQHALERERPQAVRHGEGPLLEDLRLPGRHCAAVRRQTCQIHDFIGCSENAVQWQVWTGLLAHLVLRYLAYLSRWGLSFSRLAGVVRGTLWIRRNLVETLRLYGTAGPVETPAARPKRLYFQAVLEFGSGAMGQQTC